MKKFLVGRGVSSLESDRIADALASFRPSGRQTLSWAELERKLNADPVTANKEVANPSLAIEPMAIPSEFGGEGVSSSSDGISGVVEPPKGYVTSISGKRKFRRLHYVGMCHRVPGIDFIEYVSHGGTLPKPDQYDDYCRHCWRSGVPRDVAEDSVATDSESTSTESE